MNTYWNQQTMVAWLLSAGLIASLFPAACSRDRDEPNTPPFASAADDGKRDTPILAPLPEGWIGNLVVGSRLGNYGVIKIFLDESRKEKISLPVSVDLKATGIPSQDLEVEIFTNLNRRDQAKVFERADDANRSDSYYVSHRMDFQQRLGEVYRYTTDLEVSQCGVYRVTARYRIQGESWNWSNRYAINLTPQRDMVVVVSPKKALGLSIFEVNPLAVEATEGGQFAKRSTLEDFTDHDQDGYDPFNLSFVKNTLGFNTLWLMPIFPVTQVRWNDLDKRYEQNFSPGSPYAARDYWSVNEALSSQNNQEDARKEFVYLVNQAEGMGLNVIIDVAFNHAGHDAVLGQGAVELGLASEADKLRAVKSARPAWATRGLDFRQSATHEQDAAAFAPADRQGEHRWMDAGLDWYFGNYSDLGPKPDFGDASLGGALDERDLYFTDLAQADNVREVFEYFGYILPYWLGLTGNQLDGIRADFAQGLPMRAWEYIINKTRQKKWDFVFLAEVLDPDPILYRVNRAFDLITTLYHGDLRSNELTTSRLFDIQQKEKEMYGPNAGVMHNGTSHDEVPNPNKWVMAARYAVCASLHGAPMAYMSQPLGLGHKVNFESAWSNIKSFWDGADPAVFAIYQRINRAREEHPALGGGNNYYLARKDTKLKDDNVFAVARWDDTPGEKRDLVLSFVNLRDGVTPPVVFDLPRSLPLAPVRYQAYNLASDQPTRGLWATPRAAADLIRNGLEIRFSFPNEIQLLQLAPAP